MVKIVCRVLCTATLNLVFISPSFSMDAPDELVTFDKYPQVNPAKYRVKNPGELYVLGRYYFNRMDAQYSIQVVKEYYRKLTLLGNEPAHFTQYTQQAKEALYIYAVLHFRTLNVESSAADNDRAENLMRRAADAGSTKAQQFLKTMGYD